METAKNQNDYAGAGREREGACGADWDELQ